MRKLFVCFTSIIFTGAVSAEPVFTTGYNTYGNAGLIDMPSAAMPDDAELAFTHAYTANTRRNTLTFQITPRLSGSFRYSMLYDREGRTTTLNTSNEFRFDRSLSLQYLLLEETDRRPAIAIGLNDFLGTGIYRSEYLVATKSVTPRLRLTGGIGWGRLAGVGGFSNPLGLLGERFKDREALGSNPGGQVETSNIFRGDAAFFGGLEYQASDRLKFTLEYSSDRYTLEDGATFDYRLPVNVGVSYRFRNNWQLSSHYLYGSEFGFQVTYALNPKNPPNYSGLEKAPPAIAPRARFSASALGWPTQTPPDQRTLEITVRQALEQVSLGLHGLKVEGRTARVEIDNRTYPATAQAVGRTARVLTRVLPPQIDTFVVIPVQNGVAGTQVTLDRDDLEELEHDLDGAWKILARSRLSSAEGSLHPTALRYPYFDYDFKPYFSPSLFDPDNPFRADIGMALTARYEPAPGWVLEGGIRKKLLGNLDTSTRPSDSILPRVRSEFALYEREGDPALTHLTAAYYFKLGRDVYGRVTAGYFEQQYGGISTEVLWRPAESRLAAGIEVNYVKQREFNQGFGFRDYAITTGHASLYYQFGNGYQGQLDVGRYLAGDWGATLSLDRTFKNGWSIGAFATLTDVPFDDFGEGSFDKGIRITVPIGWISGQPTKDKYSTVIRPVTRDGGARVNVRGRLYETVSDLQNTEIVDSWGRFWR